MEQLPPEEVQRRIELFDQLDAAEAAGEIRDNVPCEEIRREWFVMARDFYVAGNPERPVKDFEIGLHLGQCATAACRTLAVACTSILRVSTPEDAEELALTIDALEAGILGTES